MPKSESPTCPCCSAKQTYSTEVEGHHGSVVKCRKCGAVYTPDGCSIYRGESYGLVSPHMSDREDMAGAVYYDLRVLGSAGVARRHGWYDPQTKLILQVG